MDDASWLSDDRIEAVLAGRSTGDARADELSATLSALGRRLSEPPPRSTEWRHLAAMVGEGRVAAAKRRSRRRSAAFAATLAACVSSVGLTTGLAAADVLPNRIQHAAASAGRVVGIDLPSGAPTGHGDKAPDRDGPVTRSSKREGQLAPGAPAPRGKAPLFSGGTPAPSPAAPGQAGETPGRSESAPGQTVVTPGQTGEAPGRSGSAPGQTVVTPGQIGETPGRSGSAPGQTGETPGRSGSAPGHEGVR